MIALARCLRRDRSGVALLEFALGLPLILALGGYGVELSNYAVTHVRVNQVALQLADNSARIGADVGLSTFQLREGDINDMLQGARLVGAGIKLTTYGRVTLSSLENVQQGYDSASVQRLHWQRCIGKRADAGYDSNYGTTTKTAGSTDSAADAGTAMPDGMGDTNAKVTAPAGSGVMFVEVNYLYQPVFGSLFIAPTKIHYVASFVVRDQRNYSRIFNPSPAATASTCDLHNA